MNGETVEVNGLSGGELPPDSSPDKAVSKTAELAYHLWKKRGCPDHTPHVDWFEAERQLAADTTADDVS